MRCWEEKDVLSISKAELKGGGHFFVFEQFDSKNSALNYVSSAVCYGLPLIALLVDQKISVIVEKDNKLIYNNAFGDFIVCASNVSSAEKKEFAGLVRKMNGQFIKDLTEDTTQLITNTTKTLKYDAAVVQKIAIYHVDWIKRVYRETSKEENWFLKANSEKFHSFILPPLFDLKISTTDIPLEEKNKIREDVEDHGGKFEDAFTSKCDVLIVGKRNTQNLKFQSAQEAKIPCLEINWIYDSINAKYALSYKDYFIKPKRQKPKLDDSQSQTESEFDGSETFIQENSEMMSETIHSTVTSEMINEVEKEIIKTPLNISDLLKSTLSDENIRKAGAIFDGLNIHIYDFSFNDFKKLKKRLTACGAWCTDLDENVSHVICCSVDENNLKELIKKIQDNNWHSIVVKFEWIIDCIKERKLIPIQKNYIISDSSQSSGITNQENTKSVQQKNNKILRVVKPFETNKVSNKPPNSSNKRKLRDLDTTPNN